MTKATHKLSCVSRIVSPRELHMPKPVTLVSPGLARHKGQDLNAFADDIVIFFSAGKSVGERWLKQLLLPPPPSNLSLQPPRTSSLLVPLAGRSCSSLCSSHIITPRTSVMSLCPCRPRHDNRQLDDLSTADRPGGETKLHLLLFVFNH